MRWAALVPGAEQLSPEQMFLFANLIDKMNQQASAILQMIGGLQLPLQETA